MKETNHVRISQQLQDVPLGTIEILEHVSQNKPKSTLIEQLIGKTSGKGRIDSYRLSSWAELSFIQFAAKDVTFRHHSDKSVLEVNYCKSGRVGWNMKEGICIYMGADDLSMHTLECCADSSMSFPLDYYEGISVSIDLNQLGSKVPNLLTAANVNISELYHKYCESKRPLTLIASTEANRIFPALYDLPEQMRYSYYQLKVLELLLFLTRIQPTQEQSTSNQYYSEQVEIVKDIEALLTSHLSHRFTIDALSKQYHINATTLKSTFKAIYGLPIAAYMKNIRMQRAASLLRENTYNIAEIARMVGYESQGKFAQAFKDSFELLPTEYRKNYK